VLAVLDDSRVRILDRMLQRASVAPFGAATHDLARHVATVLRGGTTIGGESILIGVDLTSQLAPKTVSIVCDVLAETTWGKSPFLVSAVIVIADSTSARLCVLLTRWRRVIRNLALALGGLSRVG